MSFVIGLIVGLVAGAAIAYFLTSKKTVRQAAIVQDLQRQLDLSESEHERRLREATDQLRQDYAAQATTPTPPANSPAAATTASPTKSPVTPDSSSFPAQTPTAPLATPTPQPPQPEVAASPLTATAPSPLPQPVVQSPAVPDTQPSMSDSSVTATDFPISDPNAVLAASYAPDAATRRQVATAIAEILPQSGVQSQARWLPVLSRLTRDADPTVRLSAIQALAPVSAAKRLPLLQRALKDTDPAVVEAAHALISQTKGRSKLPRASKKRRLPKNK